MTEVRLIDANALEVKWFDCYECGNDCDIEYVDWCDIEKAPTIDAVPVVHGRWMYGEDVDLVCSVCGKDALNDWTCQQICTDYCPHCGAKMKRGATDV